MNCSNARDIIDTCFQENPDRKVLPVMPPDLRDHLNGCDICRTYFETVMIALHDPRLRMAIELPKKLKSKTWRTVQASSSRSVQVKHLAATMAALVIFVMGYLFGTAHVKVEPSQPLSGELYFDQFCGYLPASSFDPSRYFTPVDEISFYRFRLTGDSVMSFPSLLTGYGHYQLDTHLIERSDASVCLVFVSPLGDLLTLRIREIKNGLMDDAYIVHRDPLRVMAYSVSWFQNEWHFTISARIPPEYLLTIAKELAIRT
jgi:hypothetical protein